MTAGKLIIGSSSVPNSLTRQLIYRVNLDSGANMAISASYTVLLAWRVLNICAILEIYIPRVH